MPHFENSYSFKFLLKKKREKSSLIFELQPINCYDLLQSNYHFCTLISV